MIMRRATTTLVVAALALAACGGGDDDTDAADEPVAEEQPADDAEPATDATTADDTDTDTDTGDTDADASSDDDTGDDESSEEPADEPATDGEDPADDQPTGELIVARSLADVPERCRDQMAEFMRELEPIVGDIDWSSATIADLEQLGSDLEATTTDFEAESAAIGCDNIEFPDDNEFDLLIEFAESEAPGVAGYFEFVDTLMGGLDDGETADGGDPDDPSGLPGLQVGFADCDEAIEYLEGLIDTYDTMSEVPASELLAISGLGTVIGTCTPEQFEFLDSPEVNDFLAGL